MSMELLAAFVAAEPRALDPDFVKAGWLGRPSCCGLCVGIVVLGRSMGKHTRRAGRALGGRAGRADRRRSLPRCRRTRLRLAEDVDRVAGDPRPTS